MFARLLLLLLVLPTDARRVRAGHSGRTILLEIEDTLGSEQREAIAVRAPQMEELLKHTYMALPKNNRGAIGASIANYALHRLFLQLHSWQMKDLQPTHGAWHEHSPTAALKHAPQKLLDVFDERLNNFGLDLHELSVLAATIERLVRDEADMLLNVSFKALGFYSAQKLSANHAMNVMEAYMASYILGTDSFGEETHRELSEENVRVLLKNIGSYPRWDEVKGLLQDFSSKTDADLDLSTMSNILLQTTDRFAQLEEGECQVLKNQLLAMEERPGSGRVLLSDFYRPALHQGTLEFTESLDFLRQQGAIDESDPQSIRVIVPNYMMADSNCLASSEYFSVCCADPCEELMDQLEASVAAPSASPESLLDAVSALPLGLTNRSFAAEGELSARLHEVADHHDGEVPLHGRLFAQWMHYAFPRHCPFPHVSGTTKRQSLTQFQAERHERAAFAEYKEMREVSEMSDTRGDVSDFSMWSEDEELIDPRGNLKSNSARSFWHLPMLLALGSAATLLKFVGKSSGSVYHQKMV